MVVVRVEGSLLGFLAAGAHMIRALNLTELNDWVTQEPDPERRSEKGFFLEARTAVGEGSLDERLIRLMVWVGARFRSTTTHSGLANPLAIMKEGTAWCDQHSKVFLLMTWQLFGLVGRELALDHSDRRNGHTVVEVNYDEGWHLFDVHTEHQAVYRHPGTGHVLSYAELLANPEVLRQERHWWRGENGMGKEGFYWEGSLRSMSAPSNESIIYTHLPWTS